MGDRLLLEARVLSSNGGRFGNNNGLVTGRKSISSTCGVSFADVTQIAHLRQSCTDAESVIPDAGSSVCVYAIGFEPWLRVDCLVHVAVLDPSGIELEVQVGAESSPGLADTADDLSSLHGLA